MGQLTVADRILLHIFPHHRLRGRYDCPLALTQDGVAQALGLARAHVALELKKLEEKGLAECAVAHVTGGRARRKVYFPTPQGVERVLELRGRVLATEVPFIDAQGSPRSASVEKLLELLRQEPYRDRRVLEALHLGRPLDLRELSRRPALVPRSTPLVSRGRELAELQALAASPEVVLVSVYGVAGVGKTQLVRAALEGSDAVWLQLLPGEGPRGLLGDLGQVLEARGRPGLRHYLRTNPPQGPELPALLLQDLRGIHLALDDFTPTAEHMALLQLLLEYPGGYQLWLIGRQEVPTHFWPRLSEGRALHHFPLAGLDFEGTRMLLQGRGLDPSHEVLERLHHLTAGNPLCLQLILPQHLDRPFANLEDFMHEEVLGDLSQAQERALYRLVSYRRPVAAEALGSLSPRELRDLLKRCLILWGDGGYRLHDLVKGFLQEQLTGPQHRFYDNLALVYHLAREDFAEALPMTLSVDGPGEARRFLRAHRREILDGGLAEEVLAILGKLEVEGDPTLTLLKAQVEDQLGRWDAAVATLSSMDLGRADGTAVEAQLLLGRIRSKQLQLPEAKRLFDAAVRAARRLEDPIREAEALRRLALVQMKRGDFAASHARLGQALAVLRGRGKPREEGRLDMDRGTVYLRQGLIEEAMEPLERAAELLKDEPEDLARIYNNLGYIHGRRGNLQEADRLLNLSLSLARDRGDQRTLGYALCSAAEVRLKAGDLAQATDLCLQSLELSRRLREPEMESYAWATLGQLKVFEGPGEPVYDPRLGQRGQG